MEGSGGVDVLVDFEADTGVGLYCCNSQERAHRLGNSTVTADYFALVLIVY
jgi:hypothetical protein